VSNPTVRLSSAIRFRDEPLTGTELKCVADRRVAENKLKDMIFPAAFEKYLRG
jgi:hypothetical protein